MWHPKSDLKEGMPVYGDREKVLVPEGLSYIEQDDLIFAHGLQGWIALDSTVILEMEVSAFLIDKYPVTRREFLLFMRSNSARHSFSEFERLDFDFWNWFDESLIYDDDAPIVGVTFTEAFSYALAHGGRLPTLAEWNRAARGDKYQVYPWGNTFREDVCNFKVGADTSRDAFVQLLTPVNQFPGGASPFGTMDCVGNTREWTMTPALFRLDALSLLRREVNLVDRFVALSEVPEIYNKCVDLTSPRKHIGSTCTTKQLVSASPFMEASFAGHQQRDFYQGFRVAYDADRLDSDHDWARIGDKVCIRE